MNGITAHQLLHFRTRQGSFRVARARTLPLAFEVVLEDEEQGIRWFIVRKTQGIVLFRRDASRDAAPGADVSEALLAEVMASHRTDIAIQLERDLEIDRAAMAALQRVLEGASDEQSKAILRIRQKMLETTYQERANRTAEVLASS